MTIPSPAAADPRLERFLTLLAHWNKAYNLTAVREVEQMRLQHLADCLAVVEPLRRYAGTRRLRVLDVGSGGGLPGVVLAIANAAWSVTCVDAVGKKAAFVRHVASELSLPNLHAAHHRVETMQSPPFDVVTSRAFASLADFIRLTRHLLLPGGAWLAMKGQHPGDEIAALPAGVSVFHVEPLVIPGLNADRCLIWMRPQ